MQQFTNNMIKSRRSRSNTILAVTERKPGQYRVSVKNFKRLLRWISGIFS